MVAKSTNTEDEKLKKPETKAATTKSEEEKAVTAKVTESPKTASEEPEFSYADNLEINAQRGVKTHSKAFAIEKARKSEQNHKWG